MSKKFQLKSEYSPSGDQPTAIAQLTDGLNKGYRYQTLLGATGTGKTFTMANVINNVQKPTLVIAHNKTLAAQLCNELKEFFPDNAVEYFISYYDFYRPEAYIPKTDTFIEKNSVINSEIDRLRHSATRSLFERRDTIVVSSVSCIYGLGIPDEYLKASIQLSIGQQISRDELIKKLIHIQYERNDLVIERGKFRAKGDILEIYPPYDELFIRIEMFGDEIEKITSYELVSLKVIEKMESIVLYPSKHFIISPESLESAMSNIEAELKDRLNFFKSENKLLEAQRLEQRTNYDLEMMKEIGYCQGIENYSRPLTGRKEGESPETLIDYFPDDFLIMVDESHVSLPQIRGMYNGDRSRKMTLVDHGFRLPSALDNRPLKSEEFFKKINQIIFVSATPAPFELDISQQIAQQVIRPTGLIDPEVIVRETANQVDDLINEIKIRVEKNQRVLVTTLTKKMAEDLTTYLQDLSMKVKYLHSDIKPIQRIEILSDLRIGIFDVLIGVNLLREGLDLPEVSLVAIMDADKEGFLRSESALIQTIGRAARNVEGQVLLYADKITNSMARAMDETNRRRIIQLEHNKVNNITPFSIIKSMNNSILDKLKVSEKQIGYDLGEDINDLEDIPRIMKKLEDEMKVLSKNLEFEKAAEIRDQVYKLKSLMTKAMG
ncbi:MAG: excinuclease ABC subunit UvrB [Candidatus Sericytochromatia bacterium]|nr:excinuclease ABC subunit UvrB [Candidatus Sericytochromatia bacterium]